MTQFLVILSESVLFQQCRVEHEEKLSQAGNRMREIRDRGDAQKKERSTILINKAPPSRKAHWSGEIMSYCSIRRLAHHFASTYFID